MDQNSPKVSIILVIYNAKQYVQAVFDSIFRQTHANFEVLAVINGSTDGSKELIAQNYPQVKIIDPGKNLWFAAGNNLAINQATGEYMFLVNQDIVLEPDYLEKALPAFDNPKVGAVTGKLLRYDFVRNNKTNVIDSTGIVMSASGRARDRGQGQIDAGQYNKPERVFAVTGACPIYRKSALDSVKFGSVNNYEFFDEDFVAYWEDVDLSWRLNNAGFINFYVPEAVAFHGRTAGQAAGGYLKIFNFIAHHKKLSPQIRKLNYKNHILMYVKNAPYIHPMFVLRELAMFAYVLVFETSTLKVLPTLFSQLRGLKNKR